MTDAFGLAGKAALVIGGGQGIGESAALALARAGCRVAVVDLMRERADAVVNRIRAAGGSALPLAGDVLKDDQAISLVQQADREFSGLDVLITVVGSTGFVPLLETTAEQWDLQHRINVRYAFLVAKEFASSKVRRGTPGAITFVSSVSGIMAAPRHAPYGAAKAGLIHLVSEVIVSTRESEQE